MRDPRRGNWVSPAEIMLRRRILDSDGDGGADMLNRVFDFDLQKMDASVGELAGQRMIMFWGLTPIH